MSSRLNRRRFLQASAVAGAGYWVTADAVSATRAGRQPSGKVRIASIGVGGKGGGDSTHAGRAGEMVAICDIDEGTLGAKGDEFPQAKKFFDFRKMLEEMAKEID